MQETIIDEINKTYIACCDEFKILSDKNKFRFTYDSIMQERYLKGKVDCLRELIKKIKGECLEELVKDVIKLKDI